MSTKYLLKIKEMLRVVTKNNEEERINNLRMEEQMLQIKDIGVIPCIQIL